ncbi:unnamed protein product [Camellia sinensis]
MKLFRTRAMPVLLVVVVMVGLVEQGKGQNCGSTFFSALVQLIPCRAAVAPFSPIPPSEACCTAIKSLGQPCLCVLINGPPITGVDRNMALQLPEKCVVLGSKSTGRTDHPGKYLRIKSVVRDVGSLSCYVLPPCC